MRATYYERLGAARDVLTLGGMETPQVGPGEVCVRVRASGINPSDVKRRSGWSMSAMPFPRVIPHQDGAGVIEAVGTGVSPSRMGERVWLYEAQLGRPFGTAAEMVLAVTRNGWKPVDIRWRSTHGHCRNCPPVPQASASHRPGRLLSAHLC